MVTITSSSPAPSMMVEGVMHSREVFSFAGLSTDFFDGDGKNMSKTDIQLGLEAGYDVEVYIVDTASYTKNQLFDVIRTAVSYGVTAITLDHFRVEDAFSYLLGEF